MRYALRIQQKLQWEISCWFLASVAQNWKEILNIKLSDLSLLLLFLYLKCLCDNSFVAVSHISVCTFFLLPSFAAIVHTWFNPSSHLIILILVNC